VSAHLTDYGFVWNEMTVTRLTEHDGGVVLEVKASGGAKIQVYVTPKGRRLRIWRGHRELT